MKKILLLLALLPLMASAYDAQINGIYYNFDTDNKQATVVSGTTKYTGSVTIPETVTYNGVTYSVTTIGKYAFRACKDLTSFTIPNTVTSIGESSFFGCTGLTSVTIPNSVKTIGQYAFCSCSGIKTVTIGSGISSIGMCALGECSNLAEVYCYASVLPTMGTLVFYNTNIADATLYVPSVSINVYKNGYQWKDFGTVKDIPGYVPDIPEASVVYYDFDDNSKQATVISGDTKYIGTVTIPETVVHNGVTYTVTAIGNSAFYNCNSLISVTIPNSVTTIGSSAFVGCSGLTEVTIPNGVTSIGSSAFSNCTGLTSIKIPNSVTSLESGIFLECTALNSIIVEGGNPNYDSRNNCNAIIETATNTLVAGCKVTVIPNSVTTIGTSAFFHCSDLTSIKIPNSVTSIGQGAFNGCSGLTSVTIPNSVTSIGERAFTGCKGLTSVIIPNSVTDLGEFAFYECSGLKSVKISEGITTIMGYTFEGCSSLTSVIIPNSVKTIGINAFYKCTSLSSVMFGNSVELIGFCSFWGCKSLTSINIPNGVTTIGGRAFYNCTSLKDVTIPYSVTSIGQSSFAGCSGLTDLYCYARNVPTTDSEAFKNTNVANVTLHVPTESVNAYQTTEPWSGFGNFVAMDVEPEPLEKCATPTINFSNGKLSFDCETEGVEFVFTATPPSEISGSGNDIYLSSKYVVTVYAKKNGYEDSDIATKEIEAGTAAGIKGDVNGDEEVGMPDIMYIVQYLLNGKFPDE